VSSLYCCCCIIGRQTAHDIAAFAKESSQNAVRVLSPTDFPGVANSQQPWFIDFYAPVSLMICCHFVMLLIAYNYFRVMLICSLCIG